LSERPNLAPLSVGAGLGVVTLGVLALTRVSSPALNSWLTWRPAAETIGPGAIAIAVWLGSWALLAAFGRPRALTRRTMIVCLALVAAGLLLAFPPLDQLFA
jgi:hypothetical protein